MQFKWDPRKAAVNADDMRHHYDIQSLAGAVRGKYASRYASGPHVVRLAPDVATAFKGETEVNAALRRYLLASAGRLRQPMTAGQLFEALLNERVESVVSTIQQARSPLTLAQVRSKCPKTTARTIRLLLALGESDGRLRCERLRGVDRWSTAHQR